VIRIHRILFIKQPNVVDELIIRGANINQPDDNEFSALDFATVTEAGENSKHRECAEYIE
jgi:hypothetical protein